MSDSEEPSQQPTPSKTPKRPQAPERTDSEQSMDDPGYQSSRSRSQSRRRRRQNQRQRAQQHQQQQQQQQQRDNGGGRGSQAQSMAKIEEEQGPEAESQAQSTRKPFERIGEFSPSLMSCPPRFCIHLLAISSNHLLVCFDYHLFWQSVLSSMPFPTFPLLPHPVLEDPFTCSPFLQRT